MKSDEEIWEEMDRCAHAPETEFLMSATRGTNLIGVGWRDGTLRVAFAGKTGPKFGNFSGVPKTEFEKLKRSPYPDRLFYTNIKGRFPYESES